MGFGTCRASAWQTVSQQCTCSPMWVYLQMAAKTKHACEPVCHEAHPWLITGAPVALQNVGRTPLFQQLWVEPLAYSNKWATHWWLRDSGGGSHVRFIVLVRGWRGERKSHQWLSRNFRALPTSNEWAAEKSKRQAKHWSSSPHCMPSGNVNTPSNKKDSWAVLCRSEISERTDLQWDHCTSEILPHTSCTSTDKDRDGDTKPGSWTFW